MRATAVVIALASFVLAPSVGRACTDGGPGNRCNDGGEAWIPCGSHEDCPAGQLCGATAYCVCGDSCPEQWTPQGVRCAPRAGALEAGVPPEGCWVTELGCSYYVSCIDGGGEVPAMDAGAPMDAGEVRTPASSCSVSFGGGRAGAGSALAVAAALIALVRRSRRRAGAT